MTVSIFLGEYSPPESHCFGQYATCFWKCVQRRPEKRAKKKTKRKERRNTFPPSSLRSLFFFLPPRGCQAVDVSYSNLSSIFISQFSPSHLPNQEELITDMEPGLRHHIIPQGCQHCPGRLAPRQHGCSAPATTPSKATTRTHFSSAVWVTSFSVCRMSERPLKCRVRWRKADSRRRWQHWSFLR